jgi:hypothetical protein
MHCGCLLECICSESLTASVPVQSPLIKQQTNKYTGKHDCTHFTSGKQLTGHSSTKLMHNSPLPKSAAEACTSVRNPFLYLLTNALCAGTAYSVYRLTTGWTVRGSNSGARKIVRTHPERPWGPPGLLYNAYRVSFPGLRRLGTGVNHRTPSSGTVKERIG